MDPKEFELRLTNLASESVRSGNRQVQRAGSAIAIVLGMYMADMADVVADDLLKYLPKDLNNMPVEEFFSHEHFVECGAPKHIATRARGACINACSVKNHPSMGGFTQVIRTVRQFREKYPTEEALLQIKYLGKKCVPYVLKMLGELD